MSYNTSDSLAGRQGDAYGSTNITGSGPGSNNLSSGAYGPAPTTKGPHSSDMANKVDPRVDSDNSKGYGNTGTYGSSTTHGGPTTTGPHSTDTANRADPRIDSDGRGIDSSRSATGGYGSTGNAFDSTNTGAYGSTGTSGLGSNTTSGLDSSRTTGTSGLHSSGLDSSRTTGTSGLGASGIGSTGLDSSRTTGTSGLGSSNTTTGYGSSNAGPHDSNLANKADPRVDSDNSKSYGNTGYGSSTTGTSGLGSSTTTSGYGSTNAGPHDSNLANKADPRVDSDNSKAYSSNTSYGSSTTGTHGTHGTTGIGAGTAGGVGSNTYGSGTHNNNNNNLSTHDDTQDKRKDSTMGKLMEKAGTALHQEGIAEKGREKREQAARTDAY